MSNGEGDAQLVALLKSWRLGETITVNEVDMGDSANVEWNNPAAVPPFGWKVRGDYQFPQERKQKMDVTLHQVRVLLPLILRYIWYSIRLFFKRRKPVMNFFSVVQNKKKSGVPLGGIGSGSIGRGFRGEFCRFQMDPGNYQYEDVLADQFIVTIAEEDGRRVYQKVLSAYHKNSFFSPLSGWDWSFPAEKMQYTALYPRAWTVFDIEDRNLGIDLELTCHQISPVIPNNYKDSCLPACVFEWSVENRTPKNWQVSVTMTFRDGDGSTCCSRKGIKTCDPFEKKYCEKERLLGLTIHQKIVGETCDYSISALQTEDTTVKRCSYFDPESNGKKFWNAISSDKEFEAFTCGEGKKNLGCALKSTILMEGRSRRHNVMTFSLAWNMPKVHFAHSDVDYLRYYSRFYGRFDECGPSMCLYATEHYKRWIQDIYNWQYPILKRRDLPYWYKSALFNELYYVSDGGTVWIWPSDAEDDGLDPDDPRKQFGRFAYLEGHEYKMYNTYDVHFYASFALAMLWPALQKTLQYDFRDSITREDKTMIWYLYDGAIAPRKVKDSVPHDVGEPDDDPFNVINVYPVHDVSMWKDLNTKFVLQVYRDYVLTHDLGCLRDMYPQVITVMNKSLRWDNDHLGVIQNEGFPDQTYDTWVMQGVSAYCGGLFLAAVRVTIEMAKIMNDEINMELFQDILNRGKKAYEDKLWNGSYYRFDSSGADYSDTIMSDQLCGLWYLKSCKIIDEVFTEAHVKTALETIYAHNVLQYYEGAQGAVNGMKPDGKVDRTATQSEESWTGVTYALASLMIAEGMVEEGFKTAGGLYETLFNKAGLGFATPEALHGLDSYRAVGYMRPLSIWSIQRSLELREAAGAAGAASSSSGLPSGSGASSK